MSENFSVKLLVCGDVKNPQRKFGDAGIDCFVPNLSERFIDDLRACNPDIYFGESLPLGHTITVVDNKIYIAPGVDIKFPLYIKSNIEPNICLQLINKSGIATKQKLAIGACLIDSSYQGVIHAHLYNFSKNHTYIEFGQKIVQMVPIKIDPSTVEVFNGISEEEFYDGIKTERGAGGFGSTGV